MRASSSPRSCRLSSDGPDGTWRRFSAIAFRIRGSDVTTADVGAVMREAARAFDAILLDVDNGPDGLTRSDNDLLYRADGLHSARRALAPGGVLADLVRRTGPRLLETALALRIRRQHPQCSRRPYRTRFAPHDLDRGSNRRLIPATVTARRRPRGAKKTCPRHRSPAAMLRAPVRRAIQTVSISTPPSKSACRPQAKTRDTWRHQPMLRFREQQNFSEIFSR